jgi:hypothetical protein
MVHFVSNTGQWLKQRETKRATEDDDYDNIIDSMRNPSEASKRWAFYGSRNMQLKLTVADQVVALWVPLSAWRSTLSFQQV